MFRASTTFLRSKSPQTTSAFLMPCHRKLDCSEDLSAIVAGRSQYASTKSWFEDIAQLRERTLPFLDGSKTIPANEARTFLLSATRQINGLLKLSALEIAVSTSAALESFAARRWLGGCSIR